MREFIKLCLAGFIIAAGCSALLANDVPTLAPPAPVPIDEHEENGGIETPTPDPTPNACCLPACTFCMKVCDCYGTRWLRGWCSAGELTCWVEDPCRGVCFEVQRPRCCLPTCSCSPCCCAPSQPACVAAVPKGNGCGCGTPTVAPVPTHSIVRAVPATCPGGVCPVPAAGGGAVQQASTGRRGFILQRHNPNYFGANATGSGNRIVNVFGRQIVTVQADRQDGYAVGEFGRGYHRDTTNTMQQPKRKGLFRRR